MDIHENLNRLKDRQPTREDFAALFAELRGAHGDRGMAVLGGNVLDQALRSALVIVIGARGKQSPRLFGDYRPLQPLSAKIELAYTLGIIGDHTRANLAMISAIRNTAAHTASPFSFDDPVIVSACKALRIPKDWRPFFTSVPTDASMPPRLLFSTMCQNIAMLLVEIAQFATSEAPPSPLP